MGPFVAHAPNATRRRPNTHQMSLLFMSHAPSAKRGRCVRRVLAAGERSSRHDDELLLVAATHRGRCVSTAASRCRHQYRRRQRFSVDLVVLHGSVAAADGRLAALLAHREAETDSHRLMSDTFRPAATRGTARDRCGAVWERRYTCFIKIDNSWVTYGWTTSTARELRSAYKI